MLHELLRRVLEHAPQSLADANAAGNATALPLTPHELHTVRLVIICSNSLSILGCAYILWHFLRSTRTRHATSMSQRMVTMLSLFDLSYSFPKIFAHPRELQNKLACDAQGFALEFTGVMCTRLVCCSCRVDQLFTNCVRVNKQR